MSMWDTLKKAQKQPPTNVVNGDIKIVEEIQGGQATVMADTTPHAPAARPKFKPVDRVDGSVYEEPSEPVAEPEHPSDNFDLVGDDIGAAPSIKRATTGRPRLYPSNAAKQKAYRDRQNSA